MKTKFLKLSAIILITSVIYGCKGNSNPPEDTSPNSARQLPSPKDGSENKTWEFCKLDCAVDCSLKYVYNTEEGSAMFYIPIPEKATLSAYKISSDGTSVYFTCKNSKHDGKLINRKITIPSGLAIDQGATLSVGVAFEDYECEKPGILATKNKGSVLQGNPARRPDIKDCLCI